MKLNVYVEHIEEYFDILDAKTVIEHKPKTVFVATDEPEVISDLKKDFPKFNWIGNVTKAENSKLDNRYSKARSHTIYFL